MSFQKSHESHLPKITLLNFAESSNKLNRLIQRYDKNSYSHRFSPTFKRN